MTNVFGFVLLVSAGIVVLAVGVDVGQNLWAEKQKERKAEQEKLDEAENLLYAGIFRRQQNKNPDDTIELKVVTTPKKPVGGRHRLTAA